MIGSEVRLMLVYALDSIYVKEASVLVCFFCNKKQICISLNLDYMDIITLGVSQLQLWYTIH